MRIKQLSIALVLLFFVVAPFVSAADAATPVYYSVGQNTDDHKTGTPTITISAGVATFSTPQTATNMGVGDRVSYNGGSIAYISAKISTSQWNLVTVIGGMPAAATSQTVDTITHEFTSLSAALAGASDVTHLNTANLVAGGYMLNIPCYYDSGPDTNRVTVIGYTTGPSNFIKIYTPSNILTEVNLSQRHQGMWTTNAYRMEISGGAARAITNSQDYLSIEGLQIGLLGDDQGADAWAISSYDITGVKISSCIIKDEQTGTAAAHQGISLIAISTGKTGYVWNNIVYGFKIGSGWGINVPAQLDASLYVYNNTVYDCNHGFDTFYETPGTILKNNIAQDCTAGFSPKNNILSDYNISDLSDAPGAHSKNSAIVTFVNDASKNFHLSPLDTTARGAGTDLSSDSNLPFNDDIDGQTRIGLWDIGADQSAVAIYTLTYTAGAHGSITGTTPQTVNSGTSGTAVTAVPDPNYHFVQWSDGNTTNPRTDTNVTGNINVTASFAITTYTLTYTAGAHGSITGTTPQTVNSGTSGTAVTAVPDPNYHFVQWSDGNTTNPRTDTSVTGNINVTASFAITTYTLTYTAGAHGSITGTTPQTVNSGTSGTAVTAVPDPNYHFVQWSDGNTTNPRTDTSVTGNINVTASFAITTYTLTYTAGAHGSITGTTPQTVNSGTSGTAVTAVPDPNYHFVQWSDGNTTNPRTDTSVTGNINVTASFAITTYTLTYTAGAHGSITGTTPQTVNSGTSGTAVTAVPDPNYHFVQWSDGNTTNPRTDTNVTGNINVTASFAITAIKIGIFRNGNWYLDVNGSNTWDPGVDSAIAFGMAGDIPVVGDWNGDGKTKIGVFRNGNWYLDVNGNNTWDPGVDSAIAFGMAGDIPVVGDWNGDGKTKIGVFRNGNWYLDVNGNNTWDPGVDSAIAFGMAGDIPVVGDWNGDGKTKIGVFRNGNWYLDVNGNNTWDPGVDSAIAFGMAGDIPVVGDWNGDGKTKIGVFRNGNWYLDYNGDGAWSGCGAPGDPAKDACYNYGLSGDNPLSGAW